MTTQFDPFASQFEVVPREVTATRFKTRAEAQDVCDIFNERPGQSFHVEFRDRDWYSILVREQGRFAGYFNAIVYV